METSKKGTENKDYGAKNTVKNAEAKKSDSKTADKDSKSKSEKK